MADAGTPGAPAAGAPAPQEGAKPGAAAPPSGKETAAQIAKWKADLGEGEREYDPKHIQELAIRGKKAAQAVSIAERRAQEAAAKEKEIEAREADFRSKDPARIRRALKFFGVDERSLANEVGRELLDDMEAEKDPNLKARREAERKLRELEEERTKAQASEKEKAIAAETERHTEELSNLFLDVMQRTGLPKESAPAVFPRLASLYAAVEGSGGKVDPDLAAARVRAAIESEHKALYYKPDGKGGQVLNMDALKALFPPEAYDAIRRHAVAEYRAKSAAGQAAPPPQQRQEPELPRKTNGEKRPVGNKYFAELARMYK